MQRIRDRATPYLFDEWQFLGEKRKKMLAKGWPGIVRGELLEWLPIEQGRLCFDAKQGRPTKELYTMAGVVALQQMLDLTDRLLAAFEVETGEVSRCPAGERPIRTGCRPSGEYTANFNREKCLGCELRRRCPVRIGPQSARLKPYTGKKFRLACRRAKEKGPAFREKYRWRAGIEGTMSRYKLQLGAKRLRVREDGSGVLCGEVESAGNEHSAVWAGGFGEDQTARNAFLECFRSRIDPISCSDLVFVPGGADQRKKLLFPAPNRLTLFTGRQGWRRGVQLSNSRAFGKE